MVRSNSVEVSAKTDYRNAAWRATHTMCSRSAISIASCPIDTTASITRVLNTPVSIAEHAPFQSRLAPEF